VAREDLNKHEIGRPAFPSAPLAMPSHDRRASRAKRRGAVSLWERIWKI